MAHHEDAPSGMVHEFGMTPLTWWLAALAGTGMTLMIVAAAIGVITGQGVGLLFALGALMLLGGGGAWIGVTRPFEHFDDINQPIDGGHVSHGHDEAHEESAHDADAHTPAHH